MTQEATLTLPPANSAGPAPRRPPNSIRRTSSIDVTWPQGPSGQRRFDGRARDLFTDEDGKWRVLAEDRFEAFIDNQRIIRSISAEPPRARLSGLTGAMGGGGLRKALADVVPDERDRGTPLYLILDDIAGTSLVSSWAWAHWDPNWLEEVRKAFGDEQLEKLMASRVGICAGFAPGSSAFAPEQDHAGAEVPDLRNPQDPDGWHVLPDEPGINMRRARRIDVWFDGGIVIDSAFQDSASTPSGSRRAVHEYRLTATADRDSLSLVAIDAEPRVLPHAECPAAAPNLSRLVGTPLPALRQKVLEELRGTVGCTHLNDAVRALADVPLLAEQLSMAT